MRIITGCSRSGTSFICQALAHMGGDFGSDEELIDADEWNKKGYFENRAVNTLNHRLLFGPWSNPRLWVDIMWPKNPLIHLRKLATIAQGPVISHPALIRRRGRKLQEEMTTLGASLQGKIVKDPRFSYLMNPWEATGTVHSILYVLRHPWESASSMSKQTKLPLALTLLGWKDAVKKFWDHPPDVPIHIVDYNEFFVEEKRDAQMRTLTEFLEVDYSVESGAEVLNEILDKKLRTRNAAQNNLPKGIDALYQEIRSRMVAPS